MRKFDMKGFTVCWGDPKKSIEEHIIFNKVYIVHLKFGLSCIANCYPFNS